MVDGYQFVIGRRPVFLSSFTQFLDFGCRSGSMEERRTKPRQRVFKAGTIEFDGRGIDFRHHFGNFLEKLLCERHLALTPSRRLRADDISP